MTGDRLLEADVALLAAPQAPLASPDPAHVELRFEADADGRTYLARQRVRYPFHIGRSLRAPGDPEGMPTYYVQCCSGGLFDGDRLSWQIVAERDAHVHLTSSASTIVHEARDGCAVQAVDIEAAPGSYVEYLPDPTILLPGARLTSRVRVRAHPGASVLVWDAVVPHDHTGKGATFGWVDAQLRIEDAQGRLRARDRYRLEGAVSSRQVPGVTGSHACQAGFAVVTSAAPLAQLLEALRTALAIHSSAYVAASVLPDTAGVWIRLLAPDAHALRGTLFAAWSAVRTALLGSPPSARRK